MADLAVCGGGPAGQVWAGRTTPGSGTAGPSLALLGCQMTAGRPLVWQGCLIGRGEKRKDMNVQFEEYTVIKLKEKK